MTDEQIKGKWSSVRNNGEFEITELESAGSNCIMQPGMQKSTVSRKLVCDMHTAGITRILFSHESNCLKNVAQNMRKPTSCPKLLSVAESFSRFDFHL